MYYLQIEENVLERFTNGMLFDNAPALFYYYKTRKNKTHTHTIRTVRLAVCTKTSTYNMFVHACLNGKKNVQSPQPVCAFSVRRTRKKNSVCPIIETTRARMQLGIFILRQTVKNVCPLCHWFTRIFFSLYVAHAHGFSTYNTRIVIVILLYYVLRIINRDDSGFIITRYAIDLCVVFIRPPKIWIEDERGEFHFLFMFLLRTPRKKCQNRCTTHLLKPIFLCIFFCFVDCLV